MTNNSLIFLDTEIYIDSDGVLQLRKYTPPSSSNVISKFSKSVTPFKYKVSTLCGEIYRCNYTSATTKERAKALKELKIKFNKNNYPIILINSKISEVRSKDFAPSELRKAREQEFKKKKSRPIRKYKFALHQLQM